MTLTKAAGFIKLACELLDHESALTPAGMQQAFFEKMFLSCTCGLHC